MILSVIIFFHPWFPAHRSVKQQFSTPFFPRHPPPSSPTCIHASILWLGWRRTKPTTVLGCNKKQSSRRNFPSNFLGEIFIPASLPAFCAQQSSCHANVCVCVWGGGELRGKWENALGGWNVAVGDGLWEVGKRGWHWVKAIQKPRFRVAECSSWWGGGWWWWFRLGVYFFDVPLVRVPWPNQRTVSGR